MTTLSRRPWLRTMAPRSTAEAHRAATPLELFFDLCFVVAVAIAAERLHHAISEGHALDALPWYLLMFFGIWWAWMNFTWFASAYDTDDGPYRLTTLVQIAGVLVFAAGIGPAFDHGDLRTVVAGYVIMRLAMVTQWLRVARSDPEHRACALRYALGITVIQVLWTARLWTPDAWALVTITVLVLGELAVPIWAERTKPTTWHPHHITERYGLFTIIVLGESILAATMAVQTAITGGHGDVRLLVLAGAGLVIVFALWWLLLRPAGTPPVAVPAHRDHLGVRPLRGLRLRGRRRRRPAGGGRRQDRPQRARPGRGGLRDRRTGGGVPGRSVAAAHPPRRRRAGSAGGQGLPGGDHPGAARPPHRLRHLPDLPGAGRPGSPRRHHPPPLARGRLARQRSLDGRRAVVSGGKWR
ncbi:MAG: low temperature requirement protein A [Micromonosporaceae bacterium]